MEGEITYDIHSMTYHVRVRLGNGRTATVRWSATDTLAWRCLSCLNLPTLDLRNPWLTR